MPPSVIHSACMRFTLQIVRSVLVDLNEMLWRLCLSSHTNPIRFSFAWSNVLLSAAMEVVENTLHWMSIVLVVFLCKRKAGQIPRCILFPTPAANCAVSFQFLLRFIFRNQCLFLSFCVHLCFASMYRSIGLAALEVWSVYFSKRGKELWHPVFCSPSFELCWFCVHTNSRPDASTLEAVCRKIVEAWFVFVACSTSV